MSGKESYAKSLTRVVSFFMLMALDYYNQTRDQDSFVLVVPPQQKLPFNFSFYLPVVNVNI